MAARVTMRPRASLGGDLRRFGAAAHAAQQFDAHLHLVAEGLLRQAGDQAELVAGDGVAPRLARLAAVPDFARRLCLDVADRREAETADFYVAVGPDEIIA